MPDEATPSAPKPSAAEASKQKATVSATEQAASPDLVALTIDVANGRVVALERVDPAGARRELSAEDKARLADRQADTPLLRLVEQAFEAGIACVLGEAEEGEPEESEADGELSHLLLQSLFEQSSAKQLVESESLNRAIVGTLLGQAATSGSATTH